MQEELKNTVEKMIRIARGRTGGSQVYADMLLSLLPNSTHKVNISYWCYKADRSDFEVISELMELTKSGSQIIWEYEKYISKHKEELREIAKEEHF